MLPDPRPYFAHLSDPRRETKNKLHGLSDILMMVACSVLSGIEDWVGMEEFARAFVRWAQSALPSLSHEQICLDGKTLRAVAAKKARFIW
jgi:hypothetical protein